MEESKLYFKTRARLMEQLGEQLIKNENIALLELVKNSYDAKSRYAYVSLRDLDDPDTGRIVILDHGEGMNLDTVKNAWMEIGTDSKRRKIDEFRASNTNTSQSELPERPPLGEKGIGRFGSHKLGKKIRMVTRAANSDEIEVSIDWTSFDDYDYLGDVPISVVERNTPEIFRGKKTGTLIEITELKKTWDRRTFRELCRSLNSLNSPFESKNSFRIKLITNHQDWLDGIDDFKSIKEKALYEIEATLEGRYVTSFSYKFKPWDSLEKTAARTVEKHDVEIRVPSERGSHSNFETIDLDNYEIGKVGIKLLIFDLDTKLLRYESIDKRNLSGYLEVNGGIALYRDKIRLYEYGDRGNDWLELDARRINNPSGSISSRICIGAVYLDRLASADLIEKASREGLVENDALIALKRAIWFVLDHLVYPERNIDKDKLRTAYGGKQAKEPVLAEIKILEEKIESKVEDDSFKKDLIQSLKKIDKEYRDITDTYIRAATAGLGLGTAVHEIEKIVSELNHALDRNAPQADLVFLGKRLASSTNAYASLLRRSRSTNTTPEKIVDAAESCVRYRLRTHEIDLIKEIPEKTLRCKGGNLIISSVINLIDNSIYWIEFSGKKEKCVAIIVDEPDKDYIRITIADTGSGFCIPEKSAVQPFVTAKEGGMGIGLYLASQVLEDYSGFLSFPEYSDFTLPASFRGGAFVSLNLPKL